MFSREMVLEAQGRIISLVHRTPILTCATLDRQLGASVLFKCENFQRTGSFKFRGACNAVASLPTAVRARGVVTHSSGNYGQALALAAKLHSTPAYIVMPEDSSAIKKQATSGYGGHVTLCPPTPSGRHEVAEQIRRRTGATFLDSHDNPQVFSGQGTACLELLEDAGHLDLILVPVGGGGLLSGTLLAAEGQSDCFVIGCEPAGADDAKRSLSAGRRITDFQPHTIADGLRTPLGENTFRIIRHHVNDIVLVSESEIVDAMQFVWERMKIVIEPSSAVAVAPLLTGQIETEGRRIGVILSGGNVDLDACFEIYRGNRNEPEC
jgi:threonine dehydratase